MPIKQLIVEAEVLIEVDGHKIFRTYFHDRFDDPSTVLYTTNEDHTDWCCPCKWHFRIGDVPGYDIERDNHAFRAYGANGHIGLAYDKNHHMGIIKAAIEAGHFIFPPEN